MSSCVCKISFKSVQVCGGCCKMFRGLTFLGHSVCMYMSIYLFIHSFTLAMPSMLWRCWLSGRKGIRPVKNWLGVDDVALILQQNRLRCYGHVLRKDDDDYVKKCMEYEVEGRRPRGRPKRTWREVVREDCQARKLNKEDAMDRCEPVNLLSYHDLH